MIVLRIRRRRRISKLVEEVGKVVVVRRIDYSKLLTKVRRRGINYSEIVVDRVT